MEISVVLRAREDGAGPGHPIELAKVADELGYKELWVGEGPTWDAFVLATAAGLATRSASLTVGPVPVSVRDPASISRGAASIASVTGRNVGVALGTSSVRVVEKLHGRSRRRAVTDLRECAKALRALMDTTLDRRQVDDPDADFLRLLRAPNGPLTVAAFGDRAIQVAADYADRLLLDLVTPEQVAVLRSKLELAAGSRPRPTLTAWLPSTIEPTNDELRQIKASIARYLTVAGYREMFVDAGFEVAVEAAESGADLARLVEVLPADAPSTVGLVGDRSDIDRRLRDYTAAGLDEIAIVPVSVDDQNAKRTLEAIRSLL